jgi:integrase
VKLTDATIRALLHPERGQRDYTDDAVRGLAVRVGKRTKTFTLVTGLKRKRFTLGQYDPPRFTLAMARERARDIIAAERLRKAEPSRTTFEEALEVYYRVHLPTLRKASQRCVTQALDRHFRPILGNKPLQDIKRSDIAPVLDTMLHIPTAMHSTFKYLRAFLNWCVTRGYIETAPTDRMESPKRPPSRSRVLSADELVAIWCALPGTDYGRLIKLCILSGQRKGQWGATRREYIAGDTITWPVELMKNGKAHSLPLTPTMKALLPDRIGYLFPNENAIPFVNWTRNKDRLVDSSGVQDFRVHDFRRSWATIAAEELDIQPHIIESVLSHSSGTAVGRIYNRAKYMEPMRKALLAFEGWLHTIVCQHGGRQCLTATSLITSPASANG